jgi:sugar lactone lactonase YvrE
MERQLAAVVPWAPRCVLAESPRWHAGRWWWIDAQRGVVFRSAPSASSTQAASGEPARAWLTTGERVSVVHPAIPQAASTPEVAWSGRDTPVSPSVSRQDRATSRPPAGAVLVARGAVLQLYRDAGDEGPAIPGPVLAEVPVPAGWLLNDGLAGPAGGFYIGVVHPERDPDSGYLQHVRPDGTLGGRVAGIGLSNGMAVHPAGDLLYHADSTGRVVWAHRLDGRGDVAGSSVHLRFDPDDGMPDGLAMDVAGGLWVAVYGAGEVRRYAPSGELDMVVSVPTPQVTSVALGGPDNHDLLITTAREAYDDRRSAAEPLAGRLFSARSAHPGQPLFPVGFPAG